MPLFVFQRNFYITKAGFQGKVNMTNYLSLFVCIRRENIHYEYVSLSIYYKAVYFSPSDYNKGDE